MDQAPAAAAGLKEVVKQLQADLAALLESKAESFDIFSDEHLRLMEAAEDLRRRQDSSAGARAEPNGGDYSGCAGAEGALGGRKCALPSKCYPADSVQWYRW